MDAGSFAVKEDVVSRFSIRRALIFAFLLTVATASGFPVQAASPVAGHVEKLKGDATQSVAGDKLPLAEKGEVFVGETIETGPGARLKIRFADDSTLTLGENARVLIDEMVYVPSTFFGSRGEQGIRMVKGVFEFVSGKIGKASPNTVAFLTPVATIGIRGTTFVGGELTVGMPVGQPHYGFQIRDGAIAVTSGIGQVLLDQPGEGTFLPLTRSAAPSPVRQWTAEEAAEADAKLAF